MTDACRLVFPSPPLLLLLLLGASGCVSRTNPSDAGEAPDASVTFLPPLGDGGSHVDGGEVAIVDLGQATAVPPQPGFLYFGSDADAAVLAPLSPAFWRTSAYVAAGPTADYFLSHTKVTYILSDGWVINHPNSNPWDDWTAWDQYVSATVSTAQAEHVRVDFWDIWNEPDLTWTGTGQQLEQAFVHATRAIHVIDPLAKVVGPSISDLNLTALPGAIQFTADLGAAGTPLDAVSWHAFDMPDDVPKLAAAVRASFASNPALCAPSCPQLHVNEFSAGQYDHLPGWALAWLAAVERAHVDWATKSCWNLPEAGNQSGCAHGLSGLLLADASAPQATWHVYRAWAEFSTRVINASTPNLVVVAGQRAAGGAAVLIGRYTCGAQNQWCNFADHAVDGVGLPPTNLEVEVRGLPGSSATATVTRISRQPPQTALSAPDLISTQTVGIQSGAVRVRLDSVADAEVWEMVFGP